MKYFVISVFLTLIFLTTYAQETPTPEPIVTPTPSEEFLSYGKLYYAEEDCMPLCFFGLEIGKSDANDLLNVLEEEQTYFVWRENTNYEFAYDADGNVIDGRYALYWNDANPFESGAGRIDIRDGVVLQVGITDLLDLKLKDTLTSLPEPEYILRDPSVYSLFLTFVYLEEGVTIGHSVSKRTCQMRNFQTDFKVSRIGYDIPPFSSERSAWLDALILDPEIWQEWLTNPPDVSCEEAFLASLQPTPQPVE